MKSIVVANWKMNPGSWREAKNLFEATKKVAEKSSHASVIIAPPAVYLRPLAKGYRGKVAFAAQNAHFKAGGAHTGELSMTQVRDSGASYVIIGHAERRSMGETDDEIRQKVNAALAHKLTPILCIGEEERKHGEYYNLIRDQLRTALLDAGARVNRLIVVYEPLWTIGKDTTMSPGKMHEMSIFIRKTIVDQHGDVGHRVKVLYGGSVNDKDAFPMQQGGDVRGFLVGRASLDADEFAALLHSLK